MTTHLISSFRLLFSLYLVFALHSAEGTMKLVNLYEYCQRRGVPDVYANPNDDTCHTYLTCYFEYDVWYYSVRKCPKQMLYSTVYKVCVNQKPQGCN